MDLGISCALMTSKVISISFQASTAGVAQEMAFCFVSSCRIITTFLQDFGR